MNRSFKKCLLAAAVVALPLTGCDDLLQTEPRTATTREVVLETPEGINALLVSAYSSLRGQGGYGNDLMIAGDLMADMAIATPSSSRGSGWYNNGATATKGYYPYGALNDINLIIKYAPTVSALTEASRTNLMGSAHFLRALYYFNSVRTYGYEPNKLVNGWDRGVIIRTEPTLLAEEADFRARNTVNEVYALIESDLKAAIQMLAGSSNVYFANEAAAHGLLARVYLYWERWADAEREATSAITKTSAQLLDDASDYEKAWSTTPNPESVFELNINASTESVGSNESLLSWLSPEGLWFEYFAAPTLVALFETDDIRNAIILDGVKQNTTGKYFNKHNGHKGNYAQNLPVMRIPELYLIRAEAKIEQGRTAEGVADLNFLREKRQATAVDAAGKEAAIAAVLTERKMELAFEGHRFYDLKRRGMDIPKAAPGQQTVPYTNHRILAMWSDAQVILNPLLEQNPGY